MHMLCVCEREIVIRHACLLRLHCKYTYSLPGSRPVGKWDKKAASTLKKGDKKGAIAEKFTDGAKLYVAQVCVRVHVCVCVLCLCTRERVGTHGFLACLRRSDTQTYIQHALKVYAKKHPKIQACEQLEQHLSCRHAPVPSCILCQKE